MMSLAAFQSEPTNQRTNDGRPSEYGLAQISHSTSSSSNFLGSSLARGIIGSHSITSSVGLSVGVTFKMGNAIS